MATVGVTVSPLPRAPNAARILVVDDDPDLRRSLVEVLEEKGYEVSCANNGEEALHALAGAAPNAILLDLTMPVMDGWTFRRLQRSDPRLARIPTVVISAAYSDPRAVEGLGADAFLAKPFEVSRLTATLKALCGAATPAPESRPARGAPPRGDRGGRAAGSRPRR
jgi:CheY-like chemotaxis protein